MTWSSFTVVAVIASLFWIGGAVLSALAPSGNRSRGSMAGWIFLLGSLVFLSFIVGLWITLSRPPLRTMGETRLWYSLFLSLMGAWIYFSQRYRWVLPFSAVMAMVFVGVNLLNPQIHDRAMMPALQSVWFVPHVIVYMFAYAIMGAATLFALYLLVRSSRKAASEGEMAVCDTLVRIGQGFLTMGIVMGALWAKQAWGDWWAWDPKETWAAVTWMGYMLYILARPRIKDNRLACAWLLVAFVLLQMCWWGVGYLPSAKEMSVHVY